MDCGVKVIRKLFCESHRYEEEYEIGDDISRLYLKNGEELFVTILDIQEDYIEVKVKFDKEKDIMKIPISKIHTIL